MKIPILFSINALFKPQQNHPKVGYCLQYLDPTAPGQGTNREREILCGETDFLGEQKEV